MDFRVRVHRDVALVEVGQDDFGQRARGLFDLAIGRGHRFFRNQNRDAGALWLIVLTGNVQDVGTNDIDNFREDLRQAFRVVLFIDVLDVSLLVLRGFRVADVIDVEAQGLCQVIEPVELEFAFHR
ncbi:hypothetical protein D3C80_1088950 [compost metagenome]